MKTNSATAIGVTQVQPAGRIGVATVPPTSGNRQKVGLAFQGGSFLAGAIATGVVAGLLEKRAFEQYDINAFSGTSAGALAAAVCWRHALAADDGTMQERMSKAHETLVKQWLHNANGVIPNQATGDFVKMVDHLWSSNPMYFWWKDNVSVKWLHGEFEAWVDAYVKPEESMRLLFERYVLPADAGADLDLHAAQTAFREDKARPHLVVGATRVVDSANVHITDEDFFDELIKALVQDASDRQAAIRAAADYMRQGIMASGSIDFMNGMTTVEHGRHAGTYLDGAWSENPPLEGLLDAGVDRIWMVEVFPKECADLPVSLAEREDRREELWQNAVVEQQVDFLKKVNLWVESGMLRSSEKDLEDLRDDLRQRLQDSDSPASRRLLAAFRESDDDCGECIDPGTGDVDVEALVHRIVRPYRHIGWSCIKLPSEMQRLTAGARIVNDRNFLLGKMEMGRQMALKFAP